MNSYAEVYFGVLFHFTTHSLTSWLSFQWQSLLEFISTVLGEQKRRKRREKVPEFILLLKSVQFVKPKNFLIIKCFLSILAFHL
uniref:Ovule protein n=1 Tax=Heterorhabditis bacteriophora TaxID=37862 RepID=A0A1I7WII4_HETBA